MLQSYLLHSSEIDDLALLQRQIQGQLAELPLLQHTVGIMVCHQEFVHSGAVAAVCALLPFPVIGFTSFMIASPQQAGMFEMSITVLTSDELRFAIGRTGAMGEDVAGPLQAAYQQAYSVYNERPSLIFGYEARGLDFPGHICLQALDAICGGVPIFGSRPVDGGEANDDAYVIVNGDCESNSFAMLLFIGEVNAQFRVANFPHERALGRARITKAHGHILEELDGLPPLVFLEKMHLAAQGRLNANIMAVPMLVGFDDAVPPVARMILAIDAQGRAICSGDMPEGTTLTVTAMDNTDLLRLSGQAVQHALAACPDTAVLFIYSCYGRYLALGRDNMAEIEAVRRCIGPNQNYQLAYSTGEISPFIVAGQAHNRFHNTTFIVCALA